MPVYTVKNKETEEAYDLNCPYDELLSFLKENKEYVQVLKMPATVSGRISTHRLAGEGWQDVLKKVKKNSGRGNTINV